ncbi:NDP-sugar dehydratase or epimerase [Shewanella sediminis HAW-EB3]|uniref:NDP-sugar dehydratase or epimerase n=1 Tax=Shewanella sediminis (strain HAW-EB3) TaxID=425104 RepID=A8FXN1_SHESH|nr:NAD(P)-dependent oxidoreductase [Shewanella sediminis]ABV37604.1 NDP-sugar dehydratase or epimerase [Shewanella sediminis HAW-EB3]
MKLIIFGVTGNCGTYCAQKFLEDGWTVYGVGRSESSINHPNMNFIKGDIRTDELYTKLPTDVELVINFAGVQPSILATSENTDLTATLNAYLDVNINGVFKVLEFVRQNNIKNYVYTTSHRDYENHWSPNNFLKNDLPPAINYKGDHVMYAITKTTGKMIGDYFGEAFGVRVFNLRLPMIFMVPESPYYRNNGEPTLMPFLKVIRDAMEGKPLEIWGDPQMVRDYVHIDNLVALIKSCYKSSLNSGTFNVGTGEAVTTERFIKTIGKTFAPDPENVEYIYKETKRTYKCAIYDVSEQKELLGYQPVLLEEMLFKLKNDMTEKNCMEKWGW